MAIFSVRDVNFTKLKSLKKEDLKMLCIKFSITASANTSEMIKSILDASDQGLISTEQINKYIKDKYSEIREKEINQSGANHASIVAELNKVDSHIWGMVQGGGVDSHIQANYVRKYFKYDDIVNAMNANLYRTMESYTLCTWYNHWSTVFIEDLISLNSNVIPIIKKTKGVDVIWNEQPIDIKVTNLPKQWFAQGKTIEDAIEDPISACEYFYRLQGAQRFGAENRLFIVICNKEDPDQSWKIKRNYELIKRSVEGFFSQNLQLDPVHFSFNATPHLAHAKIMFIVE